jgi:oligopeptide transport system ATP-binding protein
VLYGGRVMEQGSADSIFYGASHPYTVGLLGAIPRLDADDEALVAIPGAPPNMARLPKGCPFSERCTLASDQCRDVMPALLPASHNPAVLRACHKSSEAVSAVSELAAKRAVYA